MNLPNKKKMIAPDDLNFGQTPFDNLTREELLRMVQAYHSALIACNGVLNIFSHNSRHQPYWTVGAGGRAQAKVDKLMKLSGNTGDGDGEIYRAFFRYADVLLFPESKDNFNNWGINDKGEMIAPNPGEERGFRPVTWNDLKPQADA